MADPKIITITRRTAESRIAVTVDRSSPRDPQLKKKIGTPMQFFNHMIETIAWRACMNIAVDYHMPDYKLTHVICEDVGITMGEAYLRLFQRAIPEGVNGDGHAVSGIDESLARVFVAFEERALLAFDQNVVLHHAERVEDMLSADLCGFFEGFAQGARCTIQIDLMKGVNPHHLWEAIFRAFGECLRKSFQPCPWRAGTTPGVKGHVFVEES